MSYHRAITNDFDRFQDITRIAQDDTLVKSHLVPTTPFPPQIAISLRI